jgi:glycosyltransferase 2 family protein
MAETPKAPLPPVTPAADPPTVLASRGRLVVRSLLGVSVGLAVAVLAAYLLHVRPEVVAANLAGVPLWAVAACVGSGFVMLGLQALRWHLVMKPLLGLTYGQAYRAQVVGFMFNAILPARGGDLLRVQYLGRRTGKSRATILGTEVVDRWLDLWGWMPTAIVLAFVSDVPSWIYTALAVFGGALGGGAIAMLVLTRRGYTPTPGSRLGAVFSSFAAGIKAFASRRIVVIALAVAPLSWLWEACMIRLVTPAFGIHVDLTRAFCVLVGFNIAMVVPSPGAIGTVEGGGTAAFAFFHIDPAQALAFMFVYHFAQLLPGIIAGIAILVAEGEHLFGTVPSSAPEPSPPDPPG